MVGSQIVFPPFEPGQKWNEYEHHYLSLKKYAVLAGINVVFQL
jgi:hypothetical protein